MLTQHNVYKSWIEMTVVLVLVGMVTSAHGKSLDSPAAPTNLASAMWTLENIYTVLDTRATNVTKRAGASAFVEPAGGPTNGTMHTLDDIMTLVTNRAPVQKTGQKKTYAIGDDATNQVGVAWPNPRFTVQSNTNCVRDNLTGLIWARNANLYGQTNWGAAVTNCNDLDYGERSDWRLPNKLELQSLIDHGRSNPALCNTEGAIKWSNNDPFTGVQGAEYWSSTSLADSTTHAWYVTLFNGAAGLAIKTTVNMYVWPVCGGR